MGSLEFEDRPRQEVRRQGLAGHQGDAAAPHAAQVLDLRAHLLQVGVAPARVAEEQFAGSGEPNAPGQALEQRRAELVLQVLDAAVDGRAATCSVSAAPRIEPQRATAST